MARVLYATLVLVALLPGTAAACSLAGPVPGPGHFFLYEPATGNEIEIPVHQRGLGASCELANAFTFDGKRFAWVEGPETHSDAKPDTAFVYDIASDETREPKLTGARHERLSLSDEYLLHVSDGKLYRYRFSTGLDQIVPITLTSGHRLLWDTQIVWQRHDPAQPTSFTVYDAGTSQYVLRDKTPSQLGVPDDVNLMGFGEGWLLFSAYIDDAEQWWSYEIATEKARNLVGLQSTWPPGGLIHDDRTYSLSYDESYETQTLASYLLTDGKKTELGVVPHEAVGHLVYVDGTIVLGSYSNVDPHAHEPSAASSGNPGPGVARTISRPPAPEEPIWGIPHLGLGAAAFVLIGTALVRRRT